MKIPAFEKIAQEFKDEDVYFCMLYTREPHPTQKLMGFDFSEVPQTKSLEERTDYALKMIEDYTENRAVLIDHMPPKKDSDDPQTVQKTLGGNRPNSLIVVDKEGKVAMWQDWSEPNGLRSILYQLTGKEPPEGETLEQIIKVGKESLGKGRPKAGARKQK